MYINRYQSKSNRNAPRERSRNNHRGRDIGRKHRHYHSSKQNRSCNKCKELKKENKKLADQNAYLSEQNAALIKFITELQIKNGGSFDIKIEQYMNNNKDENNINQNDDDEKKSFDCQICLETLSTEQQHIVSACNHIFCRNCLRQHILSYSKPELPDCPIPNCGHKLQDHNDLQLLLTHTEYFKVHKKIDQVGIRYVYIDCIDYIDYADYVDYTDYAEYVDYVDYVDCIDYIYA